ncbi:hypothetical protein RclHR1_20040001 [Rhizophagus clarus]|uniref:BTB domain-containing protein n=1 Tax=Rhizophagus clarus TaxID=94130 RepID=A0A2Z6RIZ1_9GLOM|nr:hypothetical protein RclHR1_20040001 [Rhizophagus clarus]
MALNFHCYLIKDFSLMLNNADDYDVIIKVGEDNNAKEFCAHSVILRARCCYFKSAFTSDWIKKKNNMIIFNKPNITPTVFDMILNEEIFNLLIASDELLLEELINCVQDYLIEEQTSWIQQNFDLIFHLTAKVERFKKLQYYCFESIFRPYKAIIHDDIYDKIEEFHYKNILPKITIRTGKINSNIINEELINIFSNWIDKKLAMDIRTGNDPLYKFSLIYRGSRDGINDISFNNKCKRQAATLVLIEVQNSNRIFGGYKPNGLFQKNASNSFIFSFKKHSIMQTMKIYREDRISEERGFNFYNMMYMINQNIIFKDYSEKFYKTDSLIIKEIETFIVTK